MFSKNTPAVLATLILGITLSGSALACSTDGWDGGTVGMVDVGQPFGGTDLTGVARVEEFCAMVASGSGHVQTNSPAHTEVWNRFYVLPDFTGGGSTEILVGYSDQVGTTELFNIGFDGANFTFDVAGGGSGSFAAPAGWSLIEYHWDGTTFEFWVNADATVDPFSGSVAAAGGTLESVRLGLPNGLGGFGGMVNFDSFEMHNTTAVGPLLIGDADGDASVNVFDYFAIQSEIGGIDLAPGQPDCNLDGGVNVFDYFCVQLIIGGG